MKNAEDLRQEEREEIARIAYAYWETRDREDGHDVEDWLLAEEEVTRRRRAAQSTVVEQRVKRTTAA
jgi:hypothetical protein